MNELTQNEEKLKKHYEYEIAQLEQIITALILQQSDDEVLISAVNWQAAAVICKMPGYYVDNDINGGKLVGIVPF